MSTAEQREWLEPDGRGGFASGTASGIRTRRYHALLLPATTPPTGRIVLVSGADVWIDGPFGSVALSSQRYAPDVVHPDGVHRIVSFSHEPWPTWTYHVTSDVQVRHELFVDRESAATVSSWHVVGACTAILRVRLFIAARDYHAMQHENGAVRFDPDVAGDRVSFRPYDGVPAVRCFGNGEYRHRPDWYRQFFYTAEQERGLDAIEDLASPGEFVFTVSETRPALLMVGAGEETFDGLSSSGAAAAYEAFVARERNRRRAFADPLDRAADAYVVRRGSGRTIVAGYPWFTDWGRDTFIALRGLCLETGRLDTARSILVEWSKTVSDGMLPNRFPDGSGPAEFNSVDASLWFVVAVHDFLQASRGIARRVTPEDRRILRSAVLSIVSGYAAATRFGIRMDDDGLLAAGVRGQQLTWMDARVGDREITPRIGKPVEVQALWINALRIAAAYERSWTEAAERADRAFVDRFWDSRRGFLADVVDVDHVRGRVDDTCRPNQILAVGGLTHQILKGPAARFVVDAVERRLLTPIGLRSLDATAPNYAGQYLGGPTDRDAVYHQGTVWPWLVGPFVDAWLRVRGTSLRARQEAQNRFIEPLLQHLDAAGLGHVSEIADGDLPFTPRGCPFQAWSLGELIRARALCRPTLRPARQGRAARGQAVTA